MENTIIAIATPPGHGGIAVLRMSGDKALQIANKVICLKNKNKSIETMQGYTAAYGQIIENENVVDNVVVLVFRKPNSYTGEDTVEISCHGGEWASKQILKICLLAGAQMATAGEFTKRAFLNDKLSLSQAEGVLELITSNSYAQASYAQAMLKGVKNQRLEKIKNILVNEVTHLNAWIDYPEEDVDDIQESELLKKIIKCRREVSDILKEQENFYYMKRGIKAVIFGNPNVGKSTIFNLLLGYERAITTSIAGTTRDVLKDELEIQGFPLFLYDTAGLRISEDLIEAEGIKRTVQQVEVADILLAVFDASDYSSFKREDVPISKGIPILAIFNKNDIAPNFDLTEHHDQFDAVLSVSAKENPGATKDKIEEAISKLLQLKQLDPSYNLIASERQYRELQTVQNELWKLEDDGKYGIIYDIARENITNALMALHAFDGEDPSEDMIDKIFEKFCVGK